MAGADGEARPAAVEAAWTVTCQEIADSTLFPKAESWIFGANVPGKKHTVMFFMGGLGMYRGKLAELRAADYEGFLMRDRALLPA